MAELVYIVDSLQGIMGNVNDLIQATSPEEIDAIESEILKNNSRFDANLKTFETTLMSPEAIQIADETRQNAIRADEANQRAVAGGEHARVGNAQMETTKKAMTEISKASNEISQIIKVIDDIAFQTNILALNAAVEAARAGEHGKGFAVVAQEVRSLPILSSQALKETTQLIAGSLEKMEAGTAVANQTSLSLKGILDEFEKLAALVGDVAGASNDQALFIAQINRGIEEVSMVVQTNSAKPNKVPPLAKNSRHRRNYLYKWFVPLRLEQFK